MFIWMVETTECLQLGLFSLCSANVWVPIWSECSVYFMFSILYMFPGQKKKSVFDCVFFLSSLTTVPFSCPIMEVTWTWSPPWQSNEMSWRDFRRKEGKIEITSASVSSFIFTVVEHQKQTTTRTQHAEAKGVLHLCTTVKDLKHTLIPLCWYLSVLVLECW